MDVEVDVDLDINEIKAELHACKRYGCRCVNTDVDI